MSRDRYFASLPTDDIAGELTKRVSGWYDHVRVSGAFSRMRRSYTAYYGYGVNGVGSSSEVSRGGTMGEISLVKVNHFRNLVQHILVMTTNNRPAMEARAINTDYESLAQTVLANGILDYYMRNKKLERYLKLATENALVFGEGFIRIEWDATAGDEYTVEDEPVFDEDGLPVINEETGEQEIRKNIIHSGDLHYTALNPLDVIKDLYSQDANEQDWIIVRHFRNKFDLAAKYSDLADDIISSDAMTKDVVAFDFNLNMGVDSDLIPIYEFYHRKSDAVPDGRLVVFLNDQTVLFDGALPYQGIPVYRIAPGDFIGTTQGYTPAFDLLALQEALDALYSTVVTNQSTFGVQNLMVPKGHDIAYSQLAGGLNLIEYDNDIGKPESLNLTNTPPEIFNFINKIEQTMETLSGINSVARGNPEANLRSGNALALIQSMAIQFNSGLQQSYAQLLEDVGTSTIQTLQEFAQVPRLAMITGKNNLSNLKEFKSDDLNKINRVVVDVGNPLSRTTAGKIEIADNLLQMNLVNAKQYISLLKTGNLDTILEDEHDELMLIKSENEKFSEGFGDEVIAIATDNHSLHVKIHRAVLSSPDARKNLALVQSVLAHIEEHANLLRTTDPGLLMLIGEQPLPPPQPQGAPGMPGMPPMEGAPAPGPAPQGGPQSGGPAAVMSNDLALQGTKLPGVPGMPTNPLTNRKFDPSTGGL